MVKLTFSFYSAITAQQQFQADKDLFQKVAAQRGWNYCQSFT
jgi:hypothetical protein